MRLTVQAKDTRMPHLLGLLATMVLAGVLAYLALGMDGDVLATWEATS
jgi:hypothetical protein